MANIQKGKMNNPYTCGDVFWQLIRLTLLGGLIYVSWLYGEAFAIKQKFDRKALVKFLAFLVGAFAYYIVNEIFNLMVYMIFRCESLNFHDYSFLLDVQENNNTIVGACIFEKYDYISMKNFLLERTAKIPKMRSKLVKRFGVYWF